MSQCKKCLDKWGRIPSAWGDSIEEVHAYQEHLDKHIVEDVDVDEEFL